MTQPMATIDIGTNSVLLTVAAQNEHGDLQAVFEDAHITRIGEGLGETQTFGTNAMQRTMTVLRDYARCCQQYDAQTIVAVGTAAFRHATNAADFVAAVRDECGITISVIPGKREAMLSYRAAAQDFGHDCLVLDIGGGSTECIWPSKSGIQAHSVPIGSVALHEETMVADPLSDDDLARMQIAAHEALATLHAPIGNELPSRLVALAGTATTLGAIHLKLERYDHAQVHGLELHITEVQTIFEQLKILTVANRTSVPGLEAGRADVIVSGIILLLETMRMYGFDRVTVSDRGVRWGLIYEHFYGDNN